MTGSAVAQRREARIVGRYALYDEIASGGMATVHFGRLLGPVGFSRAVAIKRLHPHHAKDPQFTKMFIDEARVASRVQHPNVVPTLDVVSTGDEILLVMEYVQGESLGKLLRASIAREEHVPIRIVLSIMSNILHGLHAAHEARSETGEPLEIVHRDVSPQNVLVSSDGIAKVLDFGIARAKMRLEDTDQGNIKGKVTYMAPEQLAGSPLDRRTDVYAAGVIMWELLAGKRLWERVDAPTSLLDKLFKHVDRPSIHREDVPDALDGVVLHALERDPNGRFATAREFALAIEQYAPLAPPSEVGAWVDKIAHAELSLRSLKVAEYESDPPMPEEVSGDAPMRPTRPEGVQTHMRSDKYPISRPSIHDHETAEERCGPPTPPRPMPLLSISDAAVTTRYHARSFLFELQRLSPWRKNIARAGLGFALALAVGSILLAIKGALGPGGSGAKGAAEKTNPIVVAAAPVAPPTSCPSGMSFVPGGKLFMGDDEGGALERPAHQVSITSFCIDTTEVTVDAYKACSDKGDCKRAGTTNEWDGLSPSDARALDPLCTGRDPEKRRGHPVNCVSWDMANRYCQANGKRLPTEAEWEYAARGSDGRRFPWGDDAPNPTLLNACGKECAELGKQAHIPLDALYAGDDGWPTTAPVGSFPRGRSRFGVEDLAGNVWEWTSDWYAPYPADAQLDPKGPSSGRYKIVRGGAWNASAALSLRPTTRHRDPPDKRSFGIGFRCATNKP